MDLAHFFPSLLTAFLASLVECIEALTVILAVGAVVGWRGALTGAGLALGALVVMVGILGPVLSWVPLAAIHLGIGVLLLAFGGRWLRKAILRASGILPLRDESAVYEKQSTRLQTLRAEPGTRNLAGLLPAFQVTLMEGIEVVFIVIAIGAGNRDLLMPAGIGACAALLVVALLGAALHRPITRIPENTLKFAVGVLICAFGIFWTGEGAGVRWPTQDWSVLALAVLVLAFSLLAVQILKRRIARTAHTP